jgi:N-acetylneuraminate synthase
MSLLIAEIGNNHMGSIKLAKELIRVANESGADLVKGQAFLASDIKTGSMPPEFYQHCELSEDECIELIMYARSIKTDMFFSIFSAGFERLADIQNWTKLSASQTEAGMFDKKRHDNEWTVVSVSRQTIEKKAVPRMHDAWPLLATPYMPKHVELEWIEKLRDRVNGPVGLSDHHCGVDACLKAIMWHNVNCIEKHFTLQKEIKWHGKVFRDTVHGALPRELEVIAHAMH